jgi:hypothetical protein
MDERVEIHQKYKNLVAPFSLFSGSDNNGKLLPR